MKNSFKFVLLLFLLGTAFFLEGKNITVKGKDIIIIAPDPAKSKLAYDAGKAAEDLKEHLFLLTGADVPIVQKSVPGKFAFMLNTPDPADKKKFETGEARWSITDKGIYFYGNPLFAPRVNTMDSINALYTFLEQDLSFHWIAPGSKGIVCPAKKEILTLKKGIFSFTPLLAKRGYRAGAPRKIQYTGAKLKGFFEGMDHIFPASKDVVEKYNKYVDDEYLWRFCRMRMLGTSTLKAPAYGHAFTKWWDLYSKTHPEYFALNKWGKREPETSLKNRPADKQTFTARDKMQVKICASNPAVVDQVIKNWSKYKFPAVSVCQNDNGHGYCRCEKCLTLDGLTTEQAKKMIIIPKVTDRYVYLANKTAEKIGLIKPGTLVGMYAYNQSFDAPDRIKLHPNIVVTMVPRQIGKAYTEKLVSSWRKMGMKHMMLRVNFPYYFCTGILFNGIAREMHSTLQYYYKSGLMGVDFDHLMVNWTVHGLTDYTISKFMLEPDAPYEKWEEEYCSAFGNAKEEVKEFFRYWEKNIWENRLKKDYEAAVAKRPAVIYWEVVHANMGKYYKEEDFRITGEILKKGAAKNLTEMERKRLNELQKVLEDGRMLVKSVAHPDEQTRIQAACDLMQYREKYGKDYGIDLARCVMQEMSINGRRMRKENIYPETKFLQQFSSPRIRLPFIWKFKADPDNKGMKENYFAFSPERIGKEPTFLPAGTLRNQPHTTSEANKKFLYTYKGKAWYLTAIDTPAALKDRKKIFLYLHKTGNDTEVFINGRSAGKQVGGPSSMTVDVTDFIIWDKAKQTIIISQTGTTGLARQPFLVGK